MTSKRLSDVAIVGGGAMGSSVAYFLKKRMPSLAVTVVERDPTYKECSTGLSVGSIRQQFSIRGNVEMSLFGANFLKSIDEHLTVDEEDKADVQFHEEGYLFLASDRGMDILKRNHEVQKGAGAEVAMFTPEDLAQRYPWLNLDGIAGAAFGTSNEGWFDPWSLLSCFRKKALSLGVEYVHSNCESVQVENDRVVGIEVSKPGSSETSTISCAHVVNAAGPHAAAVHRMIKNDVDLPVRPRKRNVFVLHCAEPSLQNCPMLIDKSGVYVRREGSGGYYLSGKSPDPEDDLDCDELSVDHAFFEEEIWERLATRVPAFEALKVVNSWAGYYEYNTLDQNAIVGAHPQISNYYMINGFSGHGIQQSPAAGRAISELILDGSFQTIDLREFGYERIIENRPLRERNVI